MHKTIRRARSITLHDWGLEMQIGKAAAPGTPVAKLCGASPFEEIKHLLTGGPYARPGEPSPPARKASKRKSTTKRRRRRA